ncbi:hypothetical protein EHM92_04590 [bacterium]|nr:MAG: hypothetical protein EHM92_04590 [bacterium]
MRFLRILLVLLFAAVASAMAQRELVPVTNPVYQFLFRQELRGAIHGFHWGMLPLSRKDIASFLDSLQARAVTGELLPAADDAWLRDLRVEFSYDLGHRLDATSALIPGFQLSGIFDDARQKYLYAYSDSSASVFMDGFAGWSYRAGNDQTPEPHFTSLGEIGIRLRGTLFDRLGYHVQASNGVLFSGSKEFARLDPRLQANAQFNRGENFFDFTTGYLRYDADWLAVTFGREQLLWGMGHQDRAVLSSNTVPFDFAKIDVRSNSVHYSFLHGSLVGADTNGKTLASKYIAAHRFEFNAGKRVRIGLNEAILYSNQPISFTMLNPLIFLTSAELSTEMPSTGDDAHNSLIWIDLEVVAARNLRLFGSFLIDDLKFGTIDESDISRNTNKFAWQGGLLWNDAFTLPGLLLSAEYSRINPFVQTHWTNNNSYTSWKLPLGEALQPNSDAWRFRADYAVSSRLLLSTQVQFQRTGENIVDPVTGEATFDAGSDLLHGENHLVHTNYFLQGNRVNRTLGSFTATWQPIRQYFLEVRAFAQSIRRPAQGTEENPVSVWGTVRVEY